LAVRARQILGDFAGFWTAERRKLLAELFQAIWQKEGQIVAVKPRPPLAPCFTAIRDAQEERLKDPKADPKSGVTIAGATGLEPATSGVTGRRSNQLSYAPGRQATGARAGIISGSLDLEAEGSAVGTG
jgi:hypothetical protein